MSKNVIIALISGMIAIIAAFIILIVEKNKIITELENIDYEPAPQPKKNIPKKEVVPEPINNEPEIKAI
jgi:hypothetical protein